MENDEDFQLLLILFHQNVEGKIYLKKKFFLFWLNRSSPRPYRSTRDRESLSPGPSPQPTSQQSTQRGSVYTHEDPSSKHQSMYEKNYFIAFWTDSI